MSRSQQQSGIPEEEVIVISDDNDDVAGNEFPPGINSSAHTVILISDDENNPAEGNLYICDEYYHNIEPQENALDFSDLTVSDEEIRKLLEILGWTWADFLSLDNVYFF